ncbi:CHAP domain-containing protein [Nocardioides terrisoli]|uniref:CHAP domain-containing protein n=1 Tax=Nocardioides terrisoli TaxID=3388267 RepID=UPI00287BC834|nr:CHAP domain-containing protein [Nocardioides marmorisolisilvae]
MRINLHSRRRVSLTWSHAFLALALALGVLVGTASAGQATPGQDDYPTTLKNATQDSKVDPWRFYNRECTSFVAWRLNNDNKIPFDDYWGTHWGNASNWKAAATSLGFTVDNRPVVGAVAWWRAGSAGSSVGHVAWVWKVSSDSITVEEYNYLRRGYYDTRTIASTSSVWPSGFIHLHDMAFSNTTKPAISGTPQVGQPLKASPGGWSPDPATYSYQWLSGGDPVAGATSRKFIPTAAQLSRRIKVQVTARRAGYAPTTVRSPRTTRVAQGQFITSVPPAVSGTAQVGVPLTVSSGTWKPAGSYTYQWYAGGVAIPGATGTAYTPVAGDLGKPITVQVRASLAGYQAATTTTAPTAAVAPGSLVNSAVPSISGTPQIGRVLTASTGTWSPAASYAYQWYDVGASGAATPIAGATASSYRPTPGVIGDQVTVVVTATRPGYTTATSRAAPTAAVVPGSFTNTAPPTVSGVAQVGRTLHATTGGWSPGGTAYAYRWFADGTTIPDATRPDFTPGAAQVGKHLTAQVTVTRNGWTTALATSSATSPVRRGVMTAQSGPGVRGLPVVGGQLRATRGRWTPQPDAIGYQWLADGEPVEGATAATFSPTRAQLGQRISVREVATTAGYVPLGASSPAVRAVRLGVASLADEPVIRGRAVLGHTLRAIVGPHTPSTTPVEYRWRRDGHRIWAAHGATYQLRRRDVGQRIGLRIVVAPQGWFPAKRYSARTPQVQSVPTMTTTSSVVRRRVSLTVSLRAPAVSVVGGRVEVRLGQTVLGSGSLRGGSRTLRVDVPGSGLRRLHVDYLGDAQVTAVSRTLRVRVG